MSKRKFAIPETITVGSAPQTEKKNGRVVPVLDIKEPLMTAAGKPVGHNPIRPTPAFTPGRSMGEIVHWRNEAARRRNSGDMTAAAPNDLVIVPLYRGISARMANQRRSQSLRDRKRSFLKRLRDQLITRKAEDVAIAAS